MPQEIFRRLEQRNLKITQVLGILALITALAIVQVWAQVGQRRMGLVLQFLDQTRFQH